MTKDIRDQSERGKESILYEQVLFQGARSWAPRKFLTKISDCFRCKYVSLFEVNTLDTRGKITWKVTHFGPTGKAPLSGFGAVHFRKFLADRFGCFEAISAI